VAFDGKPQFNLVGSWANLLNLTCWGFGPAQNPEHRAWKPQWSLAETIDLGALAPFAATQEFQWAAVVQFGGLCLIYLFIFTFRPMGPVPPWVLKIEKRINFRAHGYRDTQIQRHKQRQPNVAFVQCIPCSCSAHLAQIQIHKIRRYMRRYVSGPGWNRGTQTERDGASAREREAAISVISNCRCGSLPDFWPLLAASGHFWRLFA